ncbi:hypothetical protein ABEB36_006361 [Hypothenemus hampei]|uniref:Uncharacterized protein n=1 Tax=Hypothenemus hampei TaxID=57062 RepID=A0ABD1EQS4_HYPHA
MSVKIENGVQLFARVLQGNAPQKMENIHPHLFPHGGPWYNQVIEIYSSSNLNLHNDLLIELMARAVLPRTLHSTFKECRVIFLRTDFQIHFLKVIKTMEKLVSDKVVDKNRVVRDSLQRLVLLDCFDEEQLLVTFHNLAHLINNCQSHAGLIILDNSLSFYWNRKMMNSNTMLSFDKYSSMIIESLYEKVRDLNIVVMFGRLNVIKPCNLASYSIEVTKDGATVKDLEKKDTYTANLVL